MPIFTVTTASTNTYTIINVATTTGTAATYYNPAVQATVRRHAPEAEARAKELLLQHLSPEQRATFERHKWFIVEGGRTRTKYRVRDLGHLRANIDVLDGERVDYRLCGHADQNLVPLADNLLAQKVMLDVAEDEFLALANRHAA